MIHYHLNLHIILLLCISGEHVSHTELAYSPSEYSSISTYSSSHVIVADDRSPVLHIHQLPGGEESRTISREELGLGINDRVRAVNYCDNGWITVAVGRWLSEYIHSLRTYKVLFSST